MGIMRMSAEDYVEKCWQLGLDRAKHYTKMRAGVNSAKEYMEQCRVICNITDRTSTLVSRLVYDGVVYIRDDIIQRAIEYADRMRNP